MAPVFMLPETEIRESGCGSPFDLGADEERPQALIVTLGITHIREQQSLDLGIEGSEDGQSWSVKSLASFSQKFYCGTYQILLDLTAHPTVRFIRARWHTNRWGRGDLKPMFGMYVFLQNRPMAAVASGAA